MLKSVLTEEYPNDGYVGKCFAITKQGRNPGKQYNQFDIEEIEEPGESSHDPTLEIPVANPRTSRIGIRK